MFMAFREVGLLSAVMAKIRSQLTYSPVFKHLGGTIIGTLCSNNG